MGKPLNKIGRAIFGTPPSALELPGDANVNDEAEKAGVAFGELMRSVGLAVAETQRDLNLNGAEMAQVLSETAIDVIVAEEEEFSDEGKRIGSRSYKSTLPMINFIDPVIYEWPSVRLQGVFVAEEFTAANATNVTQVSAGASVNVGKSSGRKRKSLGIQVNVAASNTNITSSVASDSSFGRMRMTAELRPRVDIVIPKPKVVTEGPRIEFSTASPNSTNTANTERVLALRLSYKKKDTNSQNTQTQYVGIAGKGFLISALGVEVGFFDPDNASPLTDSKTNLDGEIGINLTRTFGNGDANDLIANPPIPITVTAKIGLITASTTVNL